MALGTMGGEGQPQTQAALYTRHVVHGMPLQLSITAPRWLLGRTWGAQTTTLKLESRFDHGLVQELRRLGHAIDLVSEFDSLMGHAGAVVRHRNSMMEGASDPRGDGSVAGF
jgi:oxamate amidohydrolase